MATAPPKLRRRLRGCSHGFVFEEARTQSTISPRLRYQSPPLDSAACSAATESSGTTTGVPKRRDSIASRPIGPGERTSTVTAARAMRRQRFILVAAQVMSKRSPVPSRPNRAAGPRRWRRRRRRGADSRAAGIGRSAGSSSKPEMTSTYRPKASLRPCPPRRRGGSRAARSQSGARRAMPPAVGRGHAVEFRAERRPRRRRSGRARDGRPADDRTGRSPHSGSSTTRGRSGPTGERRAIQNVAGPARTTTSGSVAIVVTSASPETSAGPREEATGSHVRAALLRAGVTGRPHEVGLQCLGGDVLALHDAAEVAPAGGRSNGVDGEHAVIAQGRSGGSAGSEQSSMLTIDDFGP